MDAQTQKYVKEIGENLDALSGKPITSGQVLDLEEHVSFLLGLVSKQETQLVKYKRIVEAAQHWRETQANGAWKMQGGSKEMFDMLQVKVARRQTLIDAVDDLKA